MVKLISFYIIRHVVSIYQIQLKLSCTEHEILKFPKTVSIFDLPRCFKLEPKPKSECFIKMSRELQIMEIFVYTPQEDNWKSYGNFNIWPIFRPGDIIDDVMATWHKTCTISFFFFFCSELLIYCRVTFLCNNNLRQDSFRFWLLHSQ